MLGENGSNMLPHHRKKAAKESHQPVGVTTRLATPRRGEADIVELSRDRAKEVERAGVRGRLKKADAHLDLYWTQRDAGCRSLHHQGLLQLTPPRKEALHVSSGRDPDRGTRDQ